MQTERPAGRGTRVTQEFQVSWGLQGPLDHQEPMESRELRDRQASRDCRGKKVLPAHQARLEYLESQEKRAEGAETESQVPPERRAKQESRVCQDWREPEARRASRDTQAILVYLVPGESLVSWGPLAGKGPQEKMVTLDPQGHRVPED